MDGKLDENDRGRGGGGGSPGSVMTGPGFGAVAVVAEGGLVLLERPVAPEVEVLLVYDEGCTGVRLWLELLDPCPCPCPLFGVSNVT